MQFLDKEVAKNLLHIVETSQDKPYIAGLKLSLFIKKNPQLLNYLRVLAKK